MKHTKLKKGQKHPNKNRPKNDPKTFKKNVRKVKNNCVKMFNESPIKTVQKLTKMHKKRPKCRKNHPK